MAPVDQYVLLVGRPLSLHIADRFPTARSYKNQLRNADISSEEITEFIIMTVRTIIISANV